MPFDAEPIAAIEITSSEAFEISPPITLQPTKSASAFIPSANSLISDKFISLVIPALTNKYFGFPPIANTSARLAVAIFPPISRKEDHARLK